MGPAGVHSPVFKLVFGIVGNIIGVGVNLAPMPIFWRIYRKKDTEKFSGLPYVFSLCAALLWVLYGLPMVTEHALLLITINVASSSIQIFYLTIFFTYASKETRIHVLKVMTACFVVLAAAAVITLAAIHPHKKRSMTVGILCVVIGVMTYASPLSVAKTVVQTKSVEFLPILLCCFLFINSIVWTCYGFFTMDKYVLIPNGLGVLLGAAQMGLFLAYRNEAPKVIKEVAKEVINHIPRTPPKTSIRKVTDDHSIEMPAEKGVITKTTNVHSILDGKPHTVEEKPAKSPGKPKGVGKGSRNVKAQSPALDDESHRGGHRGGHRGYLPK